MVYVQCGYSAQRRNFVRVLAVFFASAVAVEAFWILAPLVLVFLAGSGSVLVWRNESLPMTRVTTVLAWRISFTHPLGPGFPMEPVG